jgi:serine/threonine protein kinase
MKVKPRSHMDLKPSNLLLHSPLPGSSPILKVADFGFAHCLGRAPRDLEQSSYVSIPPHFPVFYKYMSKFLYPFFFVYIPLHCVRYRLLL